ncbi:beta-13-n-acetylglucosaminyltransferase [Holotrichia oblita]|uniref:Beta-13-n-acetylglucosaminyltransferase n=1 Tax=Holotrichia oblita TaxID=644536 RepID=A0ACB9TAB5_HOLOL|nr:beta-13-n-acetylglucosaminyltransferase [Holotrichia oblita]
MQKLHKTVILVCLCAGIFLIIVWNINNKVYVDILESDGVVYKSVLSKSDALFDLKLKYILNSKLCQNKSEQYFAVFIVTSYFANVETRSAMRRAFSNDDLKLMGLRRVFLLGFNDKDKFLTQASIANEAERFGDIVQGNFMEAYRNLTYKHVMGLKWITNYCSNTKYVIKMDDDTVVDMKQFLTLLKKLKLPSSNYIVGYILRGMTPIREPANKWYVTKEEYKLSKYPTFVSGWLYVTTPQVAMEISNLAYEDNYFWIDDVLVTGIFAQKLKIRHLNLNRYFAVHAELMNCCMQDLPNVRCDFLIGPNGGDNDMFYNFNKLSAECLANKCPSRSKALNETCVVEKKDKLEHGNAIIQVYNLS